MPDATTLLLADAHLQPGDRPAQNRRLGRFLDAAAGRAERVVLLGDFFHCWFERRGRVIGDYGEVFAQLKRAADRGLRLHHVTGNRDFAVGAGEGAAESGAWAQSPPFSGFYAPAGLRSRSALLANGVAPQGPEYRFEQGGRRVLCVHGDQYCTGDRGYRLLRWLTQGLLGRLAMAWGPFWLARLIVTHFQERPFSGGYHFPLPDRGIDWRAACAALACGADTLVCGHLHHGGRRPLLVGDRQGELVIVPPFPVRGEYAALRGDQLTFERLPESGRQSTQRVHPSPSRPST